MLLPRQEAGLAWPNCVTHNWKTIFSPRHIFGAKHFVRNIESVYLLGLDCMSVRHDLFGGVNFFFSKICLFSFFIFFVYFWLVQALNFSAKQERAKSERDLAAWFLWENRKFAADLGSLGWRSWFSSSSLCFVLLLLFVYFYLLFVLYLVHRLITVCQFGVGLTNKEKKGHNISILTRQFLRLHLCRKVWKFRLLFVQFLSMSFKAVRGHASRKKEDNYRAFFQLLFDLLSLYLLWGVSKGHNVE